MSDTGGRRPLGRRWWLAGVAIAVAVVVFLAPLASADPDGLERVAGDQGFLDRAVNFWGGLLSGYAIPGVDGPLSTVLSGLLGIGIVLGLMLLFGRALARRRG